MEEDLSMRTLLQNQFVGLLTVLPLLAILVVLQGLTLVTDGADYRKTKRSLAAASLFLICVFAATVLARFIIVR